MTRVFVCVVSLAFLTFQSGCEKAISTAGTPSTPAAVSAPPPDTHAHVHPTEGPHGGSLVELGNEEYHAELIHDDAAGTVTIWILDSAAKAMVAIDATTVTINLKHDGQGEQFELKATPDTADPAGKSSRFVSSDKELAEDLDHEGNEAQLVLTINGKQFRGALAHSHGEGGHEGHDH